MIKLCTLSVLIFAVSASAALAGDQMFQEFFGYYLHRTDTIAVGAGDAKDVNAVSEMITPWPPYVRNRSLPANGPRMTGSVQRYQDVSKVKENAAPITPELMAGSNGSGR